MQKQVKPVIYKGELLFLAVAGGIIILSVEEKIMKGFEFPNRI